MKEEDIDLDTDSDDMFQSDLENINVNVWINRLESRLQYSLVKENAKDGFLQYKMLVLHAELLAISSNKMDEEEYEKEVKEELDKVESIEDDLIKDMKESMIRYKIILKNFLKQRKANLSLNL